MAYEHIESFAERLQTIRKGINLTDGKIPPQATEIEEAVIGCLLLESNAIVKIANLIKPEVFYKDEHRIIYEAVEQLYNNGKPVDLLTVSVELRRVGKMEAVGGAFYLQELTNKVSGSANIEYWCLQLIELWMKRTAIRITQESNELAYSDSSDAFDVVNGLINSANDILDFTNETEIYSVKDSAREFYEALEQPGKSYIPSSFKLINDNLKGYAKSDLIIIGGRPGHGKTAFIINEINEISKTIPCLFFSLDMSNQFITHRFLSLDSGIEAWIIDKIKPNDERMGRINKAVASLESKKLWVYDKPADMNKIFNITRKMKLRYGVELVVLDYLQLIKFDKRKTMTQGITDIATALKNMAKELNIPVIALSQLSRDSVKGKTRKPKLDDLRESGGIEQSADKVILTFRPESHPELIEEYTQKGIFDEIEGFVWFITAKNRQGSLGENKMRFIKETMKFSDDIEQITFNAPY